MDNKAVARTSGDFAAWRGVCGFDRVIVALIQLTNTIENGSMLRDLSAGQTVLLGKNERSSVIVSNPTSPTTGTKGRLQRSNSDEIPSVLVVERDQRATAYQDHDTNLAQFYYINFVACGRKFDRRLLRAP